MTENLSEMYIFCLIILHRASKGSHLLQHCSELTRFKLVLGLSTNFYFFFLNLSFCDVQVNQHKEAERNRSVQNSHSNRDEF